MTHTKNFATLTTGILIILFALPALAHETDEPHPHPLPINENTKPLDIIKARAQQIKANAGMQINAEGPGMEAEVKMRLRASTTPATNRPPQGLKALVMMHGGLIRERFSNALTHLDKFMERIDSRIEKLKAAGVDVSRLETLQAQAEVSISTAESDIAAVRAYIEGIADGSDRATVKAELEAKIATARASIKKAHEAVRVLVRALVELAKNNRVNASTTIEADADDN